MVGPCFGIGVDVHGAGPQFFSTHAGKVNGGFAVHAGGRGDVGIKLVAWNDPHTIVFPVGVSMWRVVVVGHGGFQNTWRGNNFSIPEGSAAATRLAKRVGLHAIRTLERWH